MKKLPDFPDIKFAINNSGWIDASVSNPYISNLKATGIDYEEAKQQLVDVVESEILKAIVACHDKCTDVVTAKDRIFSMVKFHSLFLETIEKKF